MGGVNEPFCGAVHPVMEFERGNVNRFTPHGISRCFAGAQHDKKGNGAKPADLYPPCLYLTIDDWWLIFNFRMHWLMVC